MATSFRLVFPGFFAPVDHIPPAEEPDDEYPWMLTTGRRRSTYHTGTQTGQASGFNLLVPHEMLEINPRDAEEMGLAGRRFAGCCFEAWCRLRWRRG